MRASLHDEAGIATPIEMMYLLVFCLLAVLFVGFLGRLQAAGVEVLVVSEDSAGHPELGAVLGELGRQRLTNILMEGGGQVLGHCFDVSAIDEVHAFIAPKLIGGATATSPLAGQGLADMSESLRLDPSIVEVLGGDIYLHGWTARPGNTPRGCD